MTVWEILLIICGGISLLGFLFMLIFIIIDDNTKARGKENFLMLLAGLFIILIFLVWAALKLSDLWDYLSEARKHGGIRKYKAWLKQKEIEEEKDRQEREARAKAEQEEYERVKKDFLDGKITRTNLPRVEDGITSFEFKPEMGLYVDYENEVREIVYVEREYNERLNRFFQEHKDLRLYHMYKFIYLPNLCKELEDDDYLHFLFPNALPDKRVDFHMDSTYPLQYLVYSEDISKIKQGMFFFRGGMDNHGAEYIEGDYHPLLEGSDEDIIKQLDEIAKKTHSMHSRAELYYSASEPEEKECISDDYADERFSWETTDSKVVKLVEEVREKIKMLKEYGLQENMLFNLLKEKQKLSRLAVTKDMRIVLLDYNDMEIKMEPINKAVYFLFLNHPEGIIFKCLPDYRKELADIYQKIKPLGLNERAIQSIEDVTNPCLNSINEKCARIKGAFISKFDKNLAQHYYITGLRGEPKRIDLPRDLVIWE